MADDETQDLARDFSFSEEIYDKVNFVGESPATDKELFVSGYRFRNGVPIPMPLFGSKVQESLAANSIGTYPPRRPAFSMETDGDGEYLTRATEWQSTIAIPIKSESITLKKDEQVDHPAHYNEHPSGIECIEIVRHFNFNVGNVFKYLWRSAFKGATLQDHYKALWYLQDEIARLEKEKEWDS
jgi:hypothetical protein